MEKKERRAEMARGRRNVLPDEAPRARKQRKASLRGMSFDEANSALSPALRKEGHMHHAMSALMTGERGVGMEEHGPEAARVIRSVRNGRWSARGTWEDRQRPQPGDIVQVAHKVLFDAMDEGAEPLRAVNVMGQLRFDWKKSTHMVVQDLNVMASGALTIADRKGGALPENVNADIEFAADEEMDPKSKHFPHTLGLFNHGGSVRMKGREVDRVAEVDARIQQGSRRLRGDLPKVLKGWRPGDEVLLPADDFSREQELANETRTLARVRRRGLDLESPTAHAHAPILREPMRIANLSGNINLRSRNEEMDQRGHVMMMPGPQGQPGSAHFQGVVFDELGRTDKTRITSKKNQKMMYPLHFHRTGLDKQHVVKDCVVNGSPGWGFVNHGSNVNFRGNVSYDAAGAGFVTERGDERGRFVDNLAVGGRGIKDEDGQSVHAFRRLYNNNPERLRKADLGFHGDGFWMASPLARVKNNAAVGNRGNGFLFYNLGIDDEHVAARNKGVGPLSTTTTLNPAEASKVEHATPPRVWKDAPNAFRTSDLPFVGGIQDNYAAANFTGMRVRYARSFNTTVQQKFSEPIDLDGKGKKGEGPLQWTQGKLGRKELFQQDSVVSGGALVNNEIGLHASYANRIRFENMMIGRKGRGPGTGTPGTQEFKEGATTGVEFANNNLLHSLGKITIKNVGVGVRRSQKTEFAALDYNCVGCEQDELALPDAEVRELRK